MRRFLGIEVDENEVRIEDCGNYVAIYNQRGQEIYAENIIRGMWKKSEYDENNNLVYYEDDDGRYISYIYDKNNHLIYKEDSNGYWEKSHYENDNLVSLKTSEDKVFE